MKLFAPIYERMLAWARHRHAQWYLAAVSAAESSFFPIPPDVMLAPMSMATPQKWWRLALICTVASVIGGLIGYGIGVFALEMAMGLIERFGYQAKFEQVTGLFAQYGFWIVLVAGFTPIPYKVFTIAAGASGMLLVPFVLGSLVGRGLRFFMVAGLMAWGGERLEGQVRRYIEILGWLGLLLAGMVAVYLMMRGGH